MRMDTPTLKIRGKIMPKDMYGKGKSMMPSKGKGKMMPKGKQMMKGKK